MMSSFDGTSSSFKRFMKLNPRNFSRNGFHDDTIAEVYKVSETDNAAYQAEDAAKRKAWSGFNSSLKQQEEHEVAVPLRGRYNRPTERTRKGEYKELEISHTLNDLEQNKDRTQIKRLDDRENRNRDLAKTEANDIQKNMIINGDDEEKLGRMEFENRNIEHFEIDDKILQNVGNSNSENVNEQNFPSENVNSELRNSKNEDLENRNPIYTDSEKNNYGKVKFDNGNSQRENSINFKNLRKY